MKKTLSFLLAFTLLLAIMIPVSAGSGKSEDTVILYTNDVHTYIDGPLSYDVIAAIKAELEKNYREVLLLDAGDHIQGTAYGSMDKGENIIKLMNAAGYDAATLGNHEFDYGMDGCMKVIDMAEYPYLSCNFYRETEGVRKDNVLNAFSVFECGERKIAIIGITTPDSFTKTTPAYFQDENGNYIYGISSAEEDSTLISDLQTAIDDSRAAGADTVIALGHLGIDPSSLPSTSSNVISKVSGLDAFIDGHSHSTVKGDVIKDKNGDSVVLTQTGQYFDRIGMMVVNAESGEITTDFIETEEILSDEGETVGYKLMSELYSGSELVSSEAVKAIKDSWMTEIDEKLGEEIGATEVIFDNYTSDGKRLVRSSETNTGSFCADALYYLFDSMDMDVDVAIMNGGGVRNKSVYGALNYKTCKDIHTFGNVACLQTVTGQQILDALEWGARMVGDADCGGFLQVSGLRYKINTNIPSTVVSDEKSVWISAPTGSYRVYDVTVYNKSTDSWDALDPDAEYNLAGYNYTLRDLGDGFGMFDGAVNVLDYVMEDYMVLANYIKAFDGGIVRADNSPISAKYKGFGINYAEIGGSGRITVDAKVDDTTEQPETDAPQTSDISLVTLLIPAVLATAGAVIGKKR
ncbi:MAG: bifunctional metallophosphatase/5'-nucleotidase [Clostridia bacterium]|nr:bifunctional metallophosphatase/5'-nucleotidase [Clostridia bacterium]